MPGVRPVVRWERPGELQNRADRPCRGIPARCGPAAMGAEVAGLRDSHPGGHGDLVRTHASITVTARRGHQRARGVLVWRRRHRQRALRLVLPHSRCIPDCRAPAPSPLAPVRRRGRSACFHSRGSPRARAPACPERGIGLSLRVERRSRGTRGSEVAVDPRPGGAEEPPESRPASARNFCSTSCSRGNVASGGPLPSPRRGERDHDDPVPRVALRFTRGYTPTPLRGGVSPDAPTHTPGIQRSVLRACVPHFRGCLRACVLSDRTHTAGTACAAGGHPAARRRRRRADRTRCRRRRVC